MKKNNPGMVAMLYGGLKMLAYLRRAGCTIYPFDPLDRPRSRVYEVYPSHTLKRVGVKKPDLVAFSGSFERETGIKVVLSPKLAGTVSKDAADAVVACATLGSVLLNTGLDSDWTGPPPITPGEWELRAREGLIIRI